MAEHVIHSPQPDVVTPHVTVSDYVRRAMTEHGDARALLDSVSQAEFTFSQVITYTDHLAAHLTARGLGAGGHVALYGPNSPAYVISMLAAWRAGGVTVFINCLLSTDEARRQLEVTGSEFLVCGETQSNAAAELTRGTRVKHVFVDGHHPVYQPITDLYVSPSSDVTLPDPRAPDMEETAAVFFSSGTTGRPKGVLLSHGNLVNKIHGLVQNPRLGGGEHVIVYQPMSHIYGHILVLNSLTVAATAITMPRFDLQQYLHLTAKFRCSFMALVPPVVVAMNRAPHLVSRFDLSAVTTVACGAAPLSHEAEVEFLKFFSADVKLVHQGYGMTETTAGVVATPYNDESPVPQDRLHYIGVPMAGVQIKFVDLDTGASLPAHRAGELCIRGPLVMKGYLNDLEATERTVDGDGWLHSGDLGYHDGLGNVYLQDRIKELIKYKAYQVAPAELEDVLLSHPAVVDVAVVGVDDDEAGQLPLAVVVRHTTSQIKESDVIKYVAERVAHYKRLRGGVRFVEAIPKSPSGKILRRELRDMLRQSRL